MARLIRHLQTVDSTNEHALALAAAGAPDGSVVVADEQTAGRGRRGRQWHSPEGGLYLSYIVRDAAGLPRPALLTLAAGVAAARAIAGAGSWATKSGGAKAARKAASALRSGPAKAARRRANSSSIYARMTSRPRSATVILTRALYLLSRRPDRL